MIQTKSSKLFIVIILLSCVLLNACGVAKTEVPVATSVPASNTPEPTATDVPPTVTPTATPEPTATPTVTPLPSSSFAGKSIQIRLGPSTLYPLLGAAVEGDTVDLAARTEDSAWVRVYAPSEVTGWLPAENIHPDGLAIVAGLPIESVFPAPPPVIKGWRGEPVQTICIIEKYEFLGRYTIDHPGLKPETDLVAEITSALNSIGVQVVKEGSTCDATMDLGLKVDMKGATYYTYDLKNFYCYNGVNVNVAMTLKSGKVTLSGKGNRPRAQENSIYTCETYSPYEYEAYYANAEALRRIWGDGLLENMLISAQLGTRDYALTAIVNLGKAGKPFVPSIIKLMENDFTAVEMCEKTLKKVTGQNLGQDSAAWQTWWDSLPTATPKP